jgi:hypothetical protein
VLNLESFTTTPTAASPDSRHARSLGWLRQSDALPGSYRPSLMRPDRFTHTEHASGSAPMT